MHFERSFLSHLWQFERHSLQTPSTPTVPVGHSLSSMQFVPDKNLSLTQDKHVFVVEEHSEHGDSHGLHPSVVIVSPLLQLGLHSLPSFVNPSIQDVQIETLLSHVAQLDVHLSHVLWSSLEMVPDGHFGTHSCLSVSKYVVPVHDVHFVGSSLHPPHVGEHDLHSRLDPYVPNGHSSTHSVPLKKYPLSHDLHVFVESVHS